MKNHGEVMTKSEALAAVDAALTGLEDACARYIAPQMTAGVTEEDECLRAVGRAVEALARAERAVREAAARAVGADRGHRAGFAAGQWVGGLRDRGSRGEKASRPSRAGATR